MKKVLTVLLLVGLATILSGCDLSIKNTDGPDPVKLGNNIKYRLDANVEQNETTSPETSTMLEESEVSEEEARTAVKKFFSGSSSKARQFFPIQAYQDGDQIAAPLVIVQDTYPPSLNPVRVRPKGGNAGNAICGFDKERRVVFCAFNPSADPEDYPVIEVELNTRKAGTVKNTAKINVGLLAAEGGSGEGGVYVVENENKPGFPEYLPKGEYDDPNVENNVAVVFTEVVAPPKK